MKLLKINDNLAINTDAVISIEVEDNKIGVYWNNHDTTYPITYTIYGTYPDDESAIKAFAELIKGWTL